MTKEDLQAAVAEAASRAATQALSKRDADHAELARAKSESRKASDAVLRDLEAARRDVDAARTDANAKGRDLQQARRAVEVAQNQCQHYVDQLEDLRQAHEMLQTELCEARMEITLHQKLAESEAAARRTLEQQFDQRQKHVDMKSKHIDIQRVAEERGRLHAERQLELATRQIAVLESQLKPRAADQDSNTGSAMSRPSTPSARGLERTGDGRPADRASNRAERVTPSQRPAAKPLAPTPPRAPALHTPRASTPPSSRLDQTRADQVRPGVGIPRLNLSTLTDASRRPRCSAASPVQSEGPAGAGAAMPSDGSRPNPARFEKAGGHASPRRSSPANSPSGEYRADARSDRTFGSTHRLPEDPARFASTLQSSPARTPIASSCRQSSAYGYTGELPSPLPSYAVAALTAAATRRGDAVPKVQPPRSPVVRLEEANLESSARGVSPPKQPQKPVATQCS
mmetsp:Transcript_50609/g.131652  ORF Transcript_50609/g.131652 Transcript_50609/m.131652 type:complete len:458 (-) Transcript_50609:374-1747(-)